MEQMQLQESFPTGSSIQTTMKDIDSFHQATIADPNNQ